MEKKVLVINYHRVVSENDAPAPGTDAVFSVSSRAFKAQINCLLENKVSIVLLNDIVNNTVASEFSVAITIDDGNDSDHKIIYPLLREKEIPAAFFWLGNALPVSAMQAHEMMTHGFLIGSHGIEHLSLPQLTPGEQQYELEDSKKTITQKINAPVDYFAFPFGMYDQKTIALARQAGYKAACTTDVKLNFPAERPFLIHRWSVKQSTTLKEFENMVTGKPALRQKIITSKLKKSVMQVIGKTAADRLNYIFHT